MASSIDETVPEDEVRVNKSDLRANFRNAKEEIEALQAATAIPRMMAFGVVGLLEGNA